VLLMIEINKYKRAFNYEKDIQLDIIYINDDKECTKYIHDIYSNRTSFYSTVNKVDDKIIFVNSKKQVFVINETVKAIGSIFNSSRPFKIIFNDTCNTFEKNMYFNLKLIMESVFLLNSSIKDIVDCFYSNSKDVDITTENGIYIFMYNIIDLVANLSNDFISNKYMTQINKVFCVYDIVKNLPELMIDADTLLNVKKDIKNRCCECQTVHKSLVEVLKGKTIKITDRGLISKAQKENYKELAILNNEYLKIANLPWYNFLKYMPIVIDKIQEKPKLKLENIDSIAQINNLCIDLSMNIDKKYNKVFSDLKIWGNYITGAENEKFIYAKFDNLFYRILIDKLGFKSYIDILNKDSNPTKFFKTELIKALSNEIGFKNSTMEINYYTAVFLDIILKNINDPKDIQNELMHNYDCYLRENDVNGVLNKVIMKLPHIVEFLSTHNTYPTKYQYLHINNYYDYVRIIEADIINQVLLDLNEVIKNFNKVNEQGLRLAGVYNDGIILVFKKEHERAAQDMIHRSMVNTYNKFVKKVNCVLIMNIDDYLNIEI